MTEWPSSGTNSEQLHGQAFELFARFGGTDTVEAKKLGTLLASLGMNMPDEDGMPRCPTQLVNSLITLILYIYILYI